jgi:hypothetical protein
MIIISKYSGASDEMLEWFEKRTNKHIKLVQKYCDMIFDFDPDRFEGIVERGKSHDQSKFSSPEKDAYIWITWKHKCKDEGQKFECPSGMSQKMDEATMNHVRNNAHHPENHAPKFDINSSDRDAPPDHIVDANKMGNIDIAEMVADWCAMSEEKGNSPKQWADKNVGIRWKFSDEQQNLIYELIDAIWTS